MPVNARSDAQRSRILLIEAVRSLLQDGRIGFSLPELAAAAGVGVATAYRHFSTPQEAMRALHTSAIQQLLEAFARADDPGADPLCRFRRYCRVWVEESVRWGPAVRYIRSSAGLIERLAAGDEAITALHDVLATVLDALERAGRTGELDITYAVLLWVTIFDERVIYDLAEHRHWASTEIVDRLTGAAAGALGIAM